MAVVNLDFYSFELSMNMQASLILPERRGVPHSPHSEPYPVLYLLHGHGHDHTSWLRLTRIEHYLQNSDVIVVMPNANRSCYVDGVNTHRYGSYLVNELPLALKNWFNITADREHTFIAGMSMGGYGALRAAYLHPERYGAACALSPGINIHAFVRQGSAPPMPGTAEVARNFDNIFGPQETYDGSDFDLKHLASMRNAAPQLGQRFLHLCGTEDVFYQENLDYVAYIREHCPNLDYTWQDSPGFHDYNFWDRESITMLRFFGLL